MDHGAVPGREASLSTADVGTSAPDSFWRKRSSAKKSSGSRPGSSASGTGLATGSSSSLPCSPQSSISPRPVSRTISPVGTPQLTEPLTPIGRGQALPVQQGHLNKKQDGSMKKDWKRRYVVLTESQLLYFPTVQDYRSGDSGKSIDLRYCTVKCSFSPFRSISPTALSRPRRIQCGPSSSCDALAINGNQLSPNGAKSPLAVSSLAMLTESLPHPHALRARSSSPLDVKRSSSCCEEEKKSSLLAVGNCLVTPGKPTSDMMSLSFADDFPKPRTLCAPGDDGSPASRKSQGRKRSNTFSSARPLRPKAKEPKEELPSATPLDLGFKVVSLTGRLLSFEAESGEDFEAWTRAIKLQIQAALEASFSENKKKTAAGVVDKIRQLSGNSVCADCSAKDPDWASLNFGSLICINCSAIHRNLGAHLSRVRSLSLDEWSPSLVDVMVALGNKVLLSIYEAQLPGRLDGDATVEERTEFIHRKYVAKEYLAPVPTEHALHQLSWSLMEVVTSGNVVLTFHFLAHCEKEDLRRQDDSGNTPLHRSASANNVVITQLLVWGGADVSLANKEGKTPLAVAGTKCAELLKAQGAV